MSAPTRLRRAVATIAALTLALGGALLTAPLTASAAVDGFSVDDFAGNQMGTRTLAPKVPMNCDVSGNTAMTVGSGTMKLDVNVPDSDGCTYASAQVSWTAPTSVDLQQGGADRVELRYRDVTPNQPSAVTFGVKAVDVNGKSAGAYGLTRNGGAAGDFLTIRYAPAYVGDVAVFDFPAGFDKQHVKTITLYVAATTSNQNVSVTFQGIGTNVGEPAYEAPSIGGGTLVFPRSTSTTRTFTVTGSPAPDVTVTGRPAWMSATTTPTAGGTLVSLTGNPGTSYIDTTVHVHAVVANSLTADSDLRVVVPSPVSVSTTVGSTRVGQAGPLALGTASSTPASGIVGTPTGLPAGTSLGMSGTSVVLNGTPTASGDFTISATVGNEFSTASFVRILRVGEAPTAAPIPDAIAVRGEAITGFAASATGYPAPTFTASGLPQGLTVSSAGAISGTPTADVSATVTVTATNDFGSDTSSFVYRVGDRPVVSAPSTTHLVAGSASTLTVATDGSPTTVTASGLPSGMSVALVGGGWQLTGTPDRPASVAGASGVATFTATNDFGTHQATWAWVVDAAPVATGPSDASTTAGTALSGATVTISAFPTATVTVTDADGETPSLPAGLAIDTSLPGSVSIVGTPTASGTVELRITADNGIGSPAVHTLTVRALAAPAFVDAAPALTVQAGDDDTLALHWSGYETPVLSTTAVLPSWLAFDASTGVFTATPPLGVSGDFGPYAVTATNTSGEATASVTITVTTPARVSTPTDVVVDRGSAPAPQVVGSYSGYPAPSVTASGLPAGLTITASAGDLVLSGTATDEGGRYTATVRVDNGVGAADTDAFDVEVQTPGTVAVAAELSTPVGLPLSVPVTIGGYPLPTVSTSGLPLGVSFDALTSRLVGTPTESGTYTIEIVASNGVGTAVPATTTLVVRAAPVVSLTASSVTPGQQLGVEASGFLPGESVDVEVHSTPRHLASFTANSSGAISGTVVIPADIEAGSHSIVVRAASGATGSAALTVRAAAGSSSPGLALTGAAPGAGAALAMLLVLAGAATVVAVRRGRATLTR